MFLVVTLVVAAGAAPRAGAVVLPPTYPNAINKQFGQKTEGWHPCPGYGYCWFDENGWWRGRWMTENAFERMTIRLAGGLQGGGVGRSSGVAKVLAEVDKPGQAAAADGIYSKLKLATRGAGTIAALRAIKGEGLSVMERLKSWGWLKALGDIGLGLTSFEVGWKIGSKISDLFFGGSEEEETIPEVPGSQEFVFRKFEPVSAGENLCAKGNHQLRASGACSVANPFGTPALVEPNGGFLAGWRALSDHSTNVRVEAYERLSSTKAGTTAPCAIEPYDYFKGEPPGGFRVELGPDECASKTGPQPNTLDYMVFYPLQVEQLPGAEGEQGGKPRETITTPSNENNGVAPVGAPEAEQIAKECFEGTICKELPGWWWNHDPEAKAETHTLNPKLGPDPPDETEVQIPVPNIGERYGEYDKRLEALGLVAEPAVLAESQIDTTVGPEAVSTTTPYIGSNVEPGVHVKVRYNPGDAAETPAEQGVPVEEGQEEGQTGGSPGEWTPPAIPAIDLSPLKETGLGCSVFPFGIPCWLYQVTASLNVSPQCPKWDLPLYKENELHIDMCSFEPAMEIVRPVLVFVICVSLVWGFAAWGFGNGGGDD